MWMEAGDLSKDSRYIKRIRVTGGEFSGQVEEHGVCSRTRTFIYWSGFYLE